MIKQKKKTNRRLALKLTALVIISGAWHTVRAAEIAGNTYDTPQTLAGDNTLTNGAATVEQRLTFDNNATLTVSTGGTLNIRANNLLSDPANRLMIGACGIGTLRLDGGLIDVTSGNSPASIRVGFSDNAASASGTLIMTSGTIKLQRDATANSSWPTLVVGFGANSSGVFQQTGGVTVIEHGNLQAGIDGSNGLIQLSGTAELQGLGADGHLQLGEGIGTGILQISGSSRLVWNGFSDIGHFDNGVGGHGIITQDGEGSVANFGHLILGFDAGALGTYNLLAGTLEVSGQNLVQGLGTAEFNFGGGTIKVVNSDLQTALDFNLNAGVFSIIDTNSLNATISGNLTANGQHQKDDGGNALVKTGAGALTLSGSNRLDTFYALQGETRQTVGETSAMELAVGSGASSAAAYTLTGGTLTVAPSAENAGSLRVGDFGGSGTLTVSDGRLEIKDNGSLNIGNQGGSGVVNISGGEVALGAGLHVMGRSGGSYGTSSGELNISGGRLTVSAGGNLLLGNNQKEDASSAVVNHSGGTVTIESGANLWLSAKSNGGSVYNLTGGVLEIGGDSLRPHYNSANAYAFNLSGGTVKVIGSDLATDANLTLSAGASAFDTNGLNATVSGVIDGAGNLQKTGAGKLTVNSVNASGVLTVSGGSLAVKNGGSVAMEVSLLNGTTLEIDSASLGAATLAALQTSAGATLAFNLGDSNLSDVFTVSGDITIGAGTIFAVTALGGLDLDADHSWTLLAGNSLAFAGGAVNVSGGFDGKDADNFSLSVSGNNLLLSYSAVPEPSVWSLTLVTLISGALLASLKKRR